MGQLYILDLTRRAGGADITKSRKHRDGGRSLHTVATYNMTPMGLDHPKGPDGRFVDGHPSVAALGDMPDFAHRLSDADLKRAKAQNQSLASAIATEEKRRAAAAQAAKPLKAKAPVKAVPAELAERVEAAKKRPLPSDIAHFEAEFSKLTVAQIEALNTGILAGKSKKEKVADAVRNLTYRVQSEAITHATHDTGMASAQRNAEKRALQAEFKRRKALADKRGDREEYAALVAGYGTAGTGPGLPPEKATGEKDPERMRAAFEGQRNLFHGNPLPGTHAWREHEAAYAAMSDADKINDLTRRIGISQDPNEKALLTAERSDLAAKAMGKPAKPLKAKGSAALSSDKVNELHDLVNKKDLTEADRDRARAILTSMTLPQLAAYADRNDLTMTGTNKADKVNSLVFALVGGRLDSAAIASGIQRGQHETRVAALRAATDRDTARGWLTGLTVADLKVVAAKLGMRGQRGTKKELSDAIVEFTAGNRADSAAIRGGVADPPDAGSLAGQQALIKRKRDIMRKLEGAEARSRDAGRSTQSDEEVTLHEDLRKVDAEIRAFGRAPKPDAGAQPTHLEGSKPRTIGDGQFHGVHYHGDGNMGSVIQDMSERQRSINVGGKRLDDTLADVIILGHSGERGVSARQVQEWKRIAADVEMVDADAARRIRGALADIAKPSALDAESFVTATTPAPLAQLMRDVHGAAANVFKPDDELKHLGELARKWDAGELSRMRLINAIEQGTLRRHESQEGFFEIREAVRRARLALEAMGRDLVPPGRA